MNLVCYRSQYIVYITVMIWIHCGALIYTQYTSGVSLYTGYFNQYIRRYINNIIYLGSKQGT